MPKNLEGVIKTLDDLLVERREHYASDGFKYMTAGGQTARYRVERSDSEGAIRTSYILEEVTHV